MRSRQILTGSYRSPALLSRRVVTRFSDVGVEMDVVLFDLSHLI